MRLQYPFDLPTLPYSFTDMQPYISEWTMKTHYERNHRGYVDKPMSCYPQSQHINKCHWLCWLANQKGNCLKCQHSISITLFGGSQ